MKTKAPETKTVSTKPEKTTSIIEHGAELE